MSASVPGNEHARLGWSQRVSVRRAWRRSCPGESELFRASRSSESGLIMEGDFSPGFSVFHVVLSSPLWVFAGSMNSLPRKAALWLCRRTSPAGGLRLLAASPGHPSGAPAASVPPVRVCHSGTSPGGIVRTKKRGYDITRNPHLNKVSAPLPGAVFTTLSF